MYFVVLFTFVRYTSTSACLDPNLGNHIFKFSQNLRVYSNLDEDQSKKNSQQSYLQVNSNMISDL